MSKYGVFSGPYFPVFGLNTGKYGPEKTPYLDTFYTDPFVRNKQYKIYNNLKLQMPENAILLHVGYPENYENKQQGECQSAYFGYTSFTILTAAAYIRLKISIVSVCKSKDHSRIASYSCILKAIKVITIR